MSVTVRRVIALTVVLVTGLLAAAVAPANSEPEAARVRLVSYSVRVSDRNGWTMTAQGDVQFYNGYRQFKIFGDTTVNSGAFADSNGYVAIKQNIANTLNDGRWYTIGVSCLSSSCDHDRYLRTDRTQGHVYYKYIGTNRGGEYFSWPTQAGRGLKGVWVRVCHQVDGPDVCGPKSYIDNPYVAGTTP